MLSTNIVLAQRHDSEKKMELPSSCTCCEGNKHEHGHGHGHGHEQEQEITSAQVRKILWWMAIKILCLPLYLLPRRGRPVRTKALHELHPMAYLDALRGYFAMIIFTAHTMSRFWKWIPARILAIPWFQFPFRGGFASLDLFFFISGYAVTYKAVGLMQTKKKDQLLNTLASSIFRRYLRLFLPILPVMLVTAVCVKWGIAIPPDGKMKVKNEMGNPFWFWIKDSGHMLNPFTPILGYWNGQTGSELLDHTWSLGAEFRSSMMMFLFCTGTCKMTTRARKILLWLALPPFIAWQANWAAMAFVGMWFSECRQQRQRRQKQENSKLPTKTEHATPNLIDSDDVGKKSDIVQPRGILANFSKSVRSTDYRSGGAWTAERLRTIALVALFLYSFFVLKDPYDTDKMKLFPHNYLNLLVPKHWHAQMRMHMHLGIGGIMMLYPLDRLPMLQRPLLTPFSQFLGELSFGIYAVHLTVSWIVWKPRYVDWAMARYGKNAFDKFWVAFPGYFCMAILVLWAAELFRRIDMQVVRLCKALETRFFEED